MSGTSKARYESPRSDLFDFVPRNASTILDIGCADGGFAATLRAANAGAELWGLEPDTDAAARAEAAYDVVVRDTFPSSQLPSAVFDAVFMNDVLEHMVEPWGALAALPPLLSATGVVVASIPNVRHIDVWWPLLRRGEWNYADTGLLDRTHLRFFTRTTIRELFEGAGWVVESLEGINRTRHSPYGLDSWKTRMLGRLTRGRSDDLFFVQFVVVAKPKPPPRAA